MTDSTKNAEQKQIQSLRVRKAARALYRARMERKLEMWKKQNKKSELNKAP